MTTLNLHEPFTLLVLGDRVHFVVCTWTPPVELDVQSRTRGINRGGASEDRWEAVLNRDLQGPLYLKTRFPR